MAAISAQLGQPFMAHQRLIAEVGGEMIRDEETGFWVPAFPEVVVTMPRQNGKTTLVFSWELDRVLLWEPFDGKPQSVAYTAQNGSEARKKFKQDQMPLLTRSPLWPAVSKERTAAEDTALEFHNGGRISVWNSSASAGHGFSIDLGVMDEIWEDKNDDREQAFLPAMATRHDRQKLVTSTAGTELSTVLNRKVAAGRAAVEAGRTEGTAYFEWSADIRDDPEDPATWASCMPALGQTITNRTVRNALEEMRQESGDLAEFCRAWLNIPISSAGMRVIPLDVWERVCTDMIDVQPAVLSVDVNPERSWASTALADPDGNVEVVDHDRGVGWVHDRVVYFFQKYRTPVAIDVASPAGTLIEGLERAHVVLVKYNPRDYAYACQSFYDRCMNGEIKIRNRDVLHVAAAGATARTVGDGWAWARRNEQTDISPLVAVTLAVDAASKPVSRPFVM